MKKDQIKSLAQLRLNMYWIWC